MNLRRTSLTDEVFNILYERITSMHYKVGDLLPSQDNLAKEMGVSRNTVREAVNRLATVGILTAKQGLGTVIESTQTHAATLQIFEDIKKDSKKDAADIISARYTVERSIVRLAALNIKKREINQLSHNLSEQSEAIAGEDISRYTELDLRFHSLIADASGSLILRSVEMVNLELYRNIIPEIVFNSQQMKISYDSHKKIFQAISAHDPIKADEFVTDHILKILERLPKNPRLAIVKKALVTT
jgi:GntR family transcriptional repressor for pyruvate dehydrogenase complex